MKNEQTNQGNVIIPLKTRSKSKPPPILNVNINTWAKQSHGLFDYQCSPQKIVKQSFQIKESVKVLRNINTRKTLIYNFKDKDNKTRDMIQIFNLAYNSNLRVYLLKNLLSTSLEQILSINGAQKQKQIERNRLFISLQKQGSAHELKIGDFIKLGRVQLLVLQLHNSKNAQSLDYQQVYGKKQFVFHLKEQLMGCCKICLSEDATKQDPLLNPCLCKGSCGVIHLQCLRNWVNNKVKRQHYGKVMTYNFQKFSCQICMAPFPSIIRLQDGQQKPNGQYLLLQQCNQSETKSARILHFVMPEQNDSIKIGRANTSELMISDISVSRAHSQIKFSKNKFCIRDLGSKFGTLVELKQQKYIKQPIRLQHNGCIIDISVAASDKKQRSSLSAKKKISIKKQL